MNHATSAHAFVHMCDMCDTWANSLPATKRRARAVAAVLHSALHGCNAVWLLGDPFKSFFKSFFNLFFKPLTSLPHTAKTRNQSGQPANAGTLERA